MDQQERTTAHLPDTDAAATWTIDRARQLLKAWVCQAHEVADNLCIDLARATNIGATELETFADLRRAASPTYPQVVAMAAASGLPVSESVLAASRYLDAGSPSAVPPAPLQPPPQLDRRSEECTLHSGADLKSWVRSARTMRRSGRLSQARLGELVGVSPATVSFWENPDKTAAPSIDQIQRIASACGVAVPVLAFEKKRRSPFGTRRRIDVPKASTLAEEIRWTGRVLSNHAHDPQRVERNAAIFLKRFSGQGESTGTLQQIGDAHGMIRERVRQIIDKQMLHLESIEPRHECFDALSDACRQLQPMPMSEAETALRPLLGDELSLQGAIDYGVQILGRRLPLHTVKRKLAEPIVVAGDFPDWFDNALSTCKTLIRHSGAAQFTLAWAMTLREQKTWIFPDEFRKVI